MRVFGFNSALITKFPPREERTPSHDDFTLPCSFQGAIPGTFLQSFLLESRPSHDDLLYPSLQAATLKTKLTFWSSGGEIRT